MQHRLLAGLQRAPDGAALDVVVEVAGQQVGQHHGGHEVDGVARLAVDLLGAAHAGARGRRRGPLGGLLLGVVLLLDHHAEPGEGEQEEGEEKERPVRSEEEEEQEERGGQDGGEAVRSEEEEEQEERGGQDGGEAVRSEEEEAEEERGVE